MSVLNLLSILLITTVASAVTIRPVVIPGNGNETCLAQNEREAYIQNFKTVINLTLQDINIIIYECGPGLWYNIIHLNMSDSSQQCPSAWREYNTSGVRACGRPASSSGSCLICCILLVISTVECVEELLAIRLEVQMHLVSMHGVAQ